MTFFFSFLHLIGFLNANTDRNARSPANYGLMDIIAALHWLQENIAYVWLCSALIYHVNHFEIVFFIFACSLISLFGSEFGGDPKSVTLAGHSTGAACVHYLMTSNAVPEGKL